MHGMQSSDCPRLTIDFTVIDAGGGASSAVRLSLIVQLSKQTDHEVSFQDFERKGDILISMTR